MNFINFTKSIPLFLPFIVALLYFSNIVKADIIVPPTDIFWTPFTIGVFLANLLLNLLIFGIGFLIFIERNICKINKKSFIITIILITLLGFFADSIALQFYETDSTLPLIISIIIVAILIFIFNYLICTYYLNLSYKKSIILGVWMAILTNPFLYIIITGLISELLTPLVPYNPTYPTQ